MTKSIAYCTLIVTMAMVFVLAAYAPAVLSDNNSFLKGFVTSEILNVLGVILAITLASAGQLHLSFNAIEERYQRVGLSRSRAGVHRAAYFLIGLFIAAVIVVVVKPLLAKDEWSQTILNGFALEILLWNVLILISLTQTTFGMKAEIKPK